ncbi:MAG: glycosyltransferase [Chitinophagaceae bacterium]|nr:glycosyltransferase [Chitinophagaceae bacterium]
MSEPRVAFLIHGLVVGGAEKFFISLVNHFYQSGRNPLVILLSDDNELFPEMDPGVNSIIIKRSFKYDLRVGRKIKAVLEENKIDTVFCVGIFSFFLLKLYFPFNKKRKFFLSLHSTIPATTKEHLLNYVYFRSISGNDTVIFICNAQKDYLRKKYFFRPSRSLVIYNGINTSYFSVNQNGIEEKKKLKAQLAIPQNDKVIAKIARMFPEKGHTYGIDALEILHREYNCKAHLLYVGSGDKDYEEQVKQHAQKSSVSGYVHFVPHQKDVRPFHHIADVFTLTSYSIETFSLAALEAMSSGLPCSLTNIGGAAEMIFENTGMLSQAKDPSSIAKTWFTLLQKDFDAQSLHDYVEANYSLDQMICNYKKAILPETVSFSHN